MDIKEFIENFASNFNDTDGIAFTPETKFRELDEWSSMLALMTMAMVNEEYDVELSHKEIRSAQTIGDLFDFIQSHDHDE